MQRVLGALPQALIPQAGPRHTQGPGLHRIISPACPPAADTPPCPPTAPPPYLCSHAPALLALARPWRAGVVCHEARLSLPMDVFMRQMSMHCHACAQMFKHHHEEATGRTSSIGQHTLCLDASGTILNDLQFKWVKRAR